jgi:acetyl-CoA carboxylase biotin carboxyl carrier protein
MPTTGPHQIDERDDAQRRADHAAIERLANRLVRQLASRLETTGLAEIEIREGAGRVRVRRPAAGAGPAAPSVPAGAGRGSGRATSPMVAVGPGAGDGQAGRQAGRDRPDPGVAASPAVGYFSPRAGIEPGVEVRAGDRLGNVDVLGVAHEVSAPIDGIVGDVHIAAGQAVEYGQPLVTVEVRRSGGPAPVTES